MSIHSHIKIRYWRLLRACNQNPVIIIWMIELSMLNTGCIVLAIFLENYWISNTFWAPSSLYAGLMLWVHLYPAIPGITLTRLCVTLPDINIYFHLWGQSWCVVWVWCGWDRGAKIFCFSSKGVSRGLDLRWLVHFGVCNDQIMIIIITSWLWSETHFQTDWAVWWLQGLDRRTRQRWDLDADQWSI